MSLMIMIFTLKRTIKTAHGLFPEWRTLGKKIALCKYILYVFNVRIRLNRLKYRYYLYSIPQASDDRILSDLLLLQHLRFGFKFDCSLISRP